MPTRKSAANKTKAISAKGPALKIRITLRYTTPPVWREFVVNPTMRLDLFCELLLRGMGWFGGHLQELVKGSESYRPAGHFGMDDEFDEGALNASKYKVADVLEKKGSKCHWIYDFGDSWEHEIQVVESGVEWTGKLPFCTGGARACPPEDCGGIPGYEDLCDAMKDKKHPERDSLIDWLGEEFDPEAFSVNTVNKRIS
jgi:hypothetical protein